MPQQRPATLRDVTWLAKRIIALEKKIAELEKRIEELTPPTPK